MTGWGGGYVTDVEYTNGYYLTQAPNMIAATCLLNGIAIDLPWRNSKLHYLELGCGRGTNACVLAAANPGWQVTAIDFTPAAIADARRLASAAGLENVRFIEADLSEFAETAEAATLGPVDVVSAHGVWSWVQPRVRAGIVRLLDRVLVAGGMLHLSYNALPALQGMLGVQRVMREAGVRLAGRSDRQVVAGRDVLKSLAEAEAAQVTGSAVAKEMVDVIANMPVAYLAHEYMNEFWHPQFHADVARDLSAAKMDYVGSGRLHENFPDLMLSAPQRAIYDRFDDPVMRELVMDVCVNRTLRHDVYVRGAMRMPAAMRDAAMADIVLALTLAPSEFAYEIVVPAGKATLGRDFYGPVIDALEQRPHSIGELLALPNAVGKQENPGEILTMLTGTSRALIAPHMNEEASARIRRFNGVIARRDVRLDGLNNPSVMASARLGTGYNCRAVEMFLVDRLAAAGGPIDPAVLASELDPTLSAEDHAKLSGILGDVVRDRISVWHRIGVI